jgi:hypothetical protein
MLTKLRLENLKRTDHHEDLSVDGKMILDIILGLEIVDWTHLAQEWDQWQVFVNTVMSTRVP